MIMEMRKQIFRVKGSEKLTNQKKKFYMRKNGLKNIKQTQIFFSMDILDKAKEILMGH